MEKTNLCPKCQSENIYQDGNLWICPECGNEWAQSPKNGSASDSTPEETPDSAIRDAHGQILNDGDTVTVIKDLKVKGASSVIKGGTKVKNIRLSDGADGHNISCKIEGFGALNLKSEFVKKA